MLATIDDPAILDEVSQVLKNRNVTSSKQKKRSMLMGMRNIERK